MCGINGIYNFTNEPVHLEQLEKMNNKMIHRGPDDEGYYLQDNIGLAMRRLSIIDLEGGHQPIFNEDESLVLVMNGEIYNYVELRKSLIQRGHHFKTHSDTEVVIHLFEEKGPDCVTELNGMFAFAVWDIPAKELFVFRDRIGIKPLFYTVDLQSFVFSSDLSGIMANRSCNNEIDFDAFLSYLGMSYVAYPQTIIKGVRKLRPGHFVKVSSSGETVNKKYWELKEFETLKLHSVEDYSEQVLCLLKDSIRLQMRSDVPLGTFLSGGLDSSSVVALLSEQVTQPVNTFSVGFENGLNELPYARLISERFKTEHFEYMISGKDALKVMPEIINKMDEPFSDNAMIPTYILSKIAIGHGVKVILNGTGGDEIFGGYNRYRHHNRLLKTMYLLPHIVREPIGKIFNHLGYDRGMKTAGPMLPFIASISGINFSFAKKLFKNKTHYKTLLNNIIQMYKKYIPRHNVKTKACQLMHMDLKDYLVGDVLALLDKMTMAVSLEGRVPLLDHRIVELCFRIPDKTKFVDKQLKGLLKRTMRGILPEEILYMPKAGFTGPTKYWINTSLKKSIYANIVDDTIPFFKEYLDINTIKLVMNDNERYQHYSETLFSLYIFSLWYKKHLEGREIVA